MTHAVRTIEFGFPSWDDRSTIHAIVWLPADGLPARPRGDRKSVV